MFLDTSVNIPTCVGMPLKLSVDGTATVNLKINGKMDIRQLFASPASMDVTGTISPRSVQRCCVAHLQTFELSLNIFQTESCINVLLWSR